MDITPDRAKAMIREVAMRLLGKPYRWGGDDPAAGFDCSGFILELLKTIGYVGEKEDLNADMLMRRFEKKRVTAAREGALLFTVDANGRAFHVVYCLDELFQIGASGGTSKTTAVIPDRAVAGDIPYLIALAEMAVSLNAVRDNAYIKIRPINYDPKRHVLEYLF